MNEIHRNWARSTARPAIAGMAWVLLCVSQASALQAQNAPRELPPEPPPELPSVSEYSLPPAEQEGGSSLEAEGPVDESSGGTRPEPALQPAAPSPPDIGTGPPAEVGEIPPMTDNPTAPSTSPPALATPGADQIDTRQTETVASPTPAQPPSDLPAVGSSEPEPGFSTALPGTTADDAQGRSPGTMTNSGEQAKPEPVPSAALPGWLIAALLLLAAVIAAAWWWRRRLRALSDPDPEWVDEALEETTEPAAAEQQSVPVDPAPAEPEPGRVPAAPAVSPSPASPPSTPSPPAPRPGIPPGTVTSKLPLAPVPPAPEPTPAPQPEPAIGAAELVKLEFEPRGASATLINAVLEYQIRLTNISDSDLQNIQLSGALSQAQRNEAGSPAFGTQLHQIERLAQGASIDFTGDLRLPLRAITPIKFHAQSLFVPLARFLLSYEDAQGIGHEQRAGFVIGREHEPPRPKMAPFRLDLGPRSFHPVGKRPLNAN